MKKMIPGFVAGWVLLASQALAADLMVYGAGGPAPAIKALAQHFEKKTGRQVQVIAGPPGNWQSQAMQDADVFFSGSSIMMNQFAAQFPGKISLDDIEVLNIREAGILVRPGNPKNIRSFQDVLGDDIKVMVVDGSGQLSLWEDMALKNATIDDLKKLRDNIEVYAQNSGEAVNRWKTDKEIDALIIWKHWQSSDNEFIPAGHQHVIYRAVEAVVAKDSNNEKLAEEFIEYLQSAEVQAIWRQQGWVGN